MSEESGRGKSMKGPMACFHDFGKPRKALFLAVLCLHCHAQAFSDCSEPMGPSPSL